MRAIEAALPRDDGVAYFNRLYMHTTEEVVRSIEGTRFEHDEFMTRLDVVFANLYFEAFVADQRGDRVPPAWVPLFAYRERPKTLAVQFALAGMNAHINHDLTIAVVEVCRELALEPDEGGAPYRDYDRINEVLEELQDRIRSGSPPGWSPRSTMRAAVSTTRCVLEHHPGAACRVGERAGALAACRQAAAPLGVPRHSGSRGGSGRPRIPSWSKAGAGTVTRSAGVAGPHGERRATDSEEPVHVARGIGSVRVAR
jgi:hypothetical protein